MGVTISYKVWSFFLLEWKTPDHSQMHNPTGNPNQCYLIFKQYHVWPFTKHSKLDIFHRMNAIFKVKLRLVPSFPLGKMVCMSQTSPRRCACSS